MAELMPQERLQPSLLDRLTDNEPNSRQESRDQRVLSLQKLRQSVIRDLGWLLNTGSIDSLVNLDGHELAQHSVLNYGMPDLSGLTASGLDVAGIERRLRQSLLDFEPRILAKSVKVRAQVADDEMNRNALSFIIEGELWAQPVPLKLFLKTEVDLEDGRFAVSES